MTIRIPRGKPYKDTLDFIQKQLNLLDQRVLFLEEKIGDDYFGYHKDDDSYDELTVATADTYAVYIPDPATIQAYMSDEFEYDSATGEITYVGTGTNELYSLIGNITLEGYSGQNNAKVHFAVMINGGTTEEFESACTLEGPSAVSNLSLSAPFQLSTDDVITVEYKSSSTGTIRAYHVQGFIREVEKHIED